MKHVSPAKIAEAADCRSRVNEKLLKALIALLALKDEHLLDELCVIFDHARQRAGEIGAGSEEVWRGVNRQMAVLQDLVAKEDEDEVSREAHKH